MRHLSTSSWSSGSTRMQAKAPSGGETSYFCCNAGASTNTHNHPHQAPGTRAVLGLPTSCWRPIARQSSSQPAERMSVPASVMVLCPSHSLAEQRSACYSGTICWGSEEGSLVQPIVWFLDDFDTTHMPCQAHSLISCQR